MTKELATMKKLFILLCLIVSVCNSFSQTNPIDSANNVKLTENEVAKLNEKINSLEVSNSILKTQISELKERHNEQVQFYNSIHNTTIWVVSIVFLVLSGIFTAFMWIFKKPEEIWKKLRESENEAKSILYRLENQYQHQKASFLLNNKGLYSYTSNDWELIAKYSKNAIEIPEDKRTVYDWLFIGLCNYKKKDYKQSIVSFTKATELNGNLEVGFRNLGTAYEFTGDEDNAIKNYRKCTRINPKDEKAFNNLAIIYGHREMPKLAIEYFEKAIDINPKDGYIYTNLFELYLTNDLEFEKRYTTTFLNNFQYNKDLMAIYEMLISYKQIFNGESSKDIIDNWGKKYKTIGSGENFEPIEKWINKQEDKKIKKELQKAMTFFKGCED